MKKVLVLLAFCVFSFSFIGDEYSFYALNDAEITYQQLRGNSKNTIFFLWTTWCGACRAELTKDNNCNVYAENVKVYYVNIGEGKRAVSRLAQRLGLKHCIKENIILDSNGILAEEFRVIYVPTFIFFQDGKPLHKSNFINKRLVESVFNNE